MCNKRYSVFVFIILSAKVFAHTPAEPVAQGHIDFSWYWNPVLGFSYGEMWTSPSNDLSKTTQIDYYPLTESFNFSYSGSIFLFEYGITDYLSVGTEFNGFDYVLHGIRDDSWKLYPSIYSCFYPISSNSYSLSIKTEFEVSPLFSSPKSNFIGDGVFDLFSTVSNNWKIVNAPNFKLFLYADAKYIVSWVNEANQASAFYKSTYSTDGGETYQELTDVNRVFHPMSRVAIALGTELRWGLSDIYFGVNFPIVDFTLSGKYLEWYVSSFDSFISELGRNNIELAWRFRL